MENQINSHCPICNSSTFELLIENGKDYFISHGNSEDFHILNCSSCTNAWTLPPMSNEELAPFYPEQYESFVTKSGFANFLQQKKYKQDLSLIKKALPSSHASIFEIGAGRGDFLFVAKEQGYQVYGIEPGSKGVQSAKNLHQIELENKFAEEIHFQEKYDVIVARHVIEHINEPISLFENIFSNGLKDTGILFLKLPRLDSFEAKIFKNYWDGYDLPRHRVHFSKKGINFALQQVGFKEIKVKNEIVPTVRSILYFARYSKPSFLRSLAQVYVRLPHSFQTMIAQILGMMWGISTAGRMIVIAKK